MIIGFSLDPIGPNRVGAFLFKGGGIGSGRIQEDDEEEEMDTFVCESGGVWSDPMGTSLEAPFVMIHRYRSAADCFAISLAILSSANRRWFSKVFSIFRIV